VYVDGEPPEPLWAARGLEVKAAGKVFVDAHVAACGATQGLYLHHAHCHVWVFVTIYGDLRLRQTQGLEHCHKIRKRNGCEATNRKKGERLEQLMKIRIVSDYLTRMNNTRELDAIKHATSLKRKTAAGLRKLKLHGLYKSELF
jgi:hypothetical protein